MKILMITNHSYMFYQFRKELTEELLKDHEVYLSTPFVGREEELKEYSVYLGEKIAELEKNIYALAGMEFNINSPKQLGEVLFEHMKIPGGKKTKTGYSTAADVLEKLAADHPIVNHILEYRGLAKLKSTYADGLTAYIREDKRIHTSFNQTITATGRISSTEPNLQNIPVRTELGREVKMRKVPEIVFKLDESIENYRHIEELLENDKNK